MPGKDVLNMKIDEHVRASIESTLMNIVDDAVHFRDFLEALMVYGWEAAKEGNPVPPVIQRGDNNNWYLRGVPDGRGNTNRSEPMSLEQAARAYVEALIDFGKDHADE
jgi:hypothetical protein